MKKALLLVLSVSLTVGGTAAPAFDLTPRLHEIAFPDGSTLSQRYFSQGGTNYAVSIDFDTELSGDPNQALFRYQSLEGATLALKVSPERFTFTGDSLEACRKMAASFAPAGAIEEGEWQDLENPLPRPDWSSYGFARAYKLPGSTIQQSVIFLNLDPKHQLVLVTTAFKEQFKEATERSERIIQSWRVLTNEQLNAPVIN